MTNTLKSSEQTGHSRAHTLIVSIEGEPDVDVHRSGQCLSASGFRSTVCVRLSDTSVTASARVRLPARHFVGSDSDRVRDDGRRDTSSPPPSVKDPPSGEERESLGDETAPQSGLLTVLMRDKSGLKRGERCLLSVGSTALFRTSLSGGIYTQKKGMFC